MSTCASRQTRPRPSPNAAESLPDTQDHAPQLDAASWVRRPVDVERGKARALEHHHFSRVVRPMNADERERTRVALELCGYDRDWPIELFQGELLDEAPALLEAVASDEVSPRAAERQVKAALAKREAETHARQLDVVALGVQRSRRRHPPPPRGRAPGLAFPSCAVVISRDRWFLDRIATNILAFEGDSNVVGFEGNYAEYEKDRKARLGEDALVPKRVKYRKLTR